MRRTLYRLLACLLLVVAAQTVYGEATYMPTEPESYCLGTEDLGYLWHGKRYRNTGVYQFIDRTTSGDSVIYTLDLTVNHAFDSVVMLPICSHGSVEFNGKTYTEETEEILYDGTKKSDGCDSIIRLKVFFAQSFHRYDTIELSYHRTPTEWHGMVITSPGTYMDQNYNVHGCDSTYQLEVILADSISFLHITKKVICEKDTADFEWRGRKYSSTGVFMDEDKYKAQDGRDSVYSLYLTILQEYEFTYNLKLCPNTTAEYRGKTYTADSVGTHYITLHSENGCDSILKLNVDLLKGGSLDNVTIKEGEAFLWNKDGNIYTKAGRFSYPKEPVTSAEGCDSTSYLVITVTPAYHVAPETAVLCRTPEEQSYQWRGKQYYNTGTYYDTLFIPNKLIPDTIYTLKLRVGEAKETHEYMELCKAGESKTWHNKTIDKYGTYEDVLKTKTGCDSIIYLHVTYNLEADSFVTLSYRERAQWYGYTVGGSDTTYVHRVPSTDPDRCDTLKRLHVSLCYPFKSNMTDTICETRLNAGEVYMWEDEDGTKIPFRLNRDKDLRFRDSTFYNCDSSKWFHLQVLRERIKTDTVHMCEGKPESRDRSDGTRIWFDKPGRSYDTIPEPGRGRYSCDSIVEYFVIEHKPNRRAIQEAHVADTAKRYDWYIREQDKHVIVPVHKELGFEYFFDTLQSPTYGCDSVIFGLKLITDTTYLFEDTITICPKHNREDVDYNRPYVWEGHKWQGKPYVIEKAGVYWDSLRTKYTNVDSVYKLVVDTFPHYLIKEYREVCQGDSIEYHGKWYSKKGTYYDTLYTALYSCDSIYELVLNIIPIASPRVVKKDISDKEIPYVWECRDYDGTVHTHSYNWTGIYRDTVKSSRGCDSILVLDLKVWPTYNNVDIEDVKICSSQLPYEWHGKRFNTDTVYVDSMKTAVMHYDSIVTLNLKVLRSDTTYLSRDMCYGHPYRYNDSVYTKGGRYTHRLSNHLGCDSIIVLQLREFEKIFTPLDIHVKGPYTWVVPGKEDRTFITPGTYYCRDTLPAANGCDSILELRLTIHEKEVVNNYTIQECEANLPYIWRNSKPIYNDSVLLDTVKSEIADTINVVTFTILRATRDTVHPVLCQGDFYTYNGVRYTRDTLIHDTTYAELGCPKKIHSIYIQFRKTKDQNIPVTTSDEKPYEWITPEGKSYIIPTKDISASTVERADTVRYKDGLCDSIRYHLKLTIGKTYHFSDSVHLCLPDTLYWHGKRITTAGIYYDNLQTKGFGYDSIYELRVGSHNDTIIRENYNIPAGRQQVIHGIPITETGKYTVPYFDQHGCDSIYEFNVNVVYPNVVINKDTTICEGDYAPFYGDKLVQDGEYHYMSAKGDSVINLTLHVNKTDITRLDTVIGSYIAPPYIIYNKTYTEGGMYYDTLVNRFNCDSVIIIHLVVTDRVSPWDAMPLCPGSQIKIDRTIITEAGQYTFVRPSITQQLDSLYRVHVYDAPAYDLPTEVRVICQGDTVEFGGKRFTTTGNYDLYYKTAKGCDSIMHLDLTVNPIYHHDTIVTMADYDKPVKWFNSTYDTTGVYHHREPTRDLCDSTFSLKLTVVETVRDTLSDHICSGLPYTWRGKTCTQTGCYRDTVRMLDVKQSYIHTLLLEVSDPIIIRSAEIEDSEICADAEGFDIVFSFLGGTPTSYSIRFDELAKRAGFVDILDEPFDPSMKAHVPLPRYQSVIYQNHTAYVQPNYYSLRVELDNDVCGIEKSDTIEMLVRYPSWIIEQNWGDIVMPLSSEKNGGYEFVKTEWYINHVQQANAGNTYLQSDALSPGDEVVMMVVRKGENVAIPTCHLEISAFDIKAHETPVIVYPTQAPKQMPNITVEAPQEGTYAVYSSTGLLLHSGTLEEGKTTITLPAVNGIYFIRTLQGRDAETHKVILY